MPRDEQQKIAAVQEYLKDLLKADIPDAPYGLRVRAVKSAVIHTDLTLKSYDAPSLENSLIQAAAKTEIEFLQTASDQDKLDGGMVIYRQSLEALEQLEQRESLQVIRRNINL